MPKLKHAFFNVYWIVAILVAAAAYLVLGYLPPTPDWKLLLTAFGAILSFVYFVQKQRLEELKLFKELFAEFNARYDRFNDQLAKLSKDPASPLQAQDQQLVIDYFNLCAEEYLFYRLGYLPPVVWASWYCGIVANLRDPRIRQLWQREVTTDSYYGLRIARP